MVLPAGISVNPDLLEKTFMARKFVNKKAVDRRRLFEKAQHSLENQNPVRFIGFWGAYDKKGLDFYDLKAINQLKKYAQHINVHWAFGSEWLLILSDIHAIKNGCNPENINCYLNHIKAEIESATCFKTLLLSELWVKYGIYDKVLQRFHETKDNWDEIAIVKKIENQAMKYNKSGVSHRENAQYYYSMRLVESKLIECLYPDFIFFSFSSDDLKEIYPDLPTIYLWSFKRGISSAPWFKSADEKERLIYAE